MQVRPLDRRARLGSALGPDVLRRGPSTIFPVSASRGTACDAMVSLQAQEECATVATAAARARAQEARAPRPVPTSRSVA